MKPKPPPHKPQEIELKLAVPDSDPGSLARRLAQIPLLARRQATRIHLHNVYYDTPEQVLRQARVALRIRRVGSEARPQWLQTFKISGRNDSALSQRGEWEVAVPDGKLDLQALQATPWKDLDPDGSVFQALEPRFSTIFDRTLWVIHKRDRSVAEVALDLGEIKTSCMHSPICELELELLAGPPLTLFDIARQIAQTIALLPANFSKAERGYTLADGCMDKPLRADPPELTAKLSLPEATQQVLREMFCQFTSNLGLLCTCDNSQVVHQARIGWRRFRSAWRFFRPIFAAEIVPTGPALQALLTGLGKLRDLDVARTETLPPLACAYAAGDPRREALWQAMIRALTQASERQRQALRDALREPAVGADLLAITQWLHHTADASKAPDARFESKASRRDWLKRRIRQLHQRFKLAGKENDQPTRQHRVRILAKRLRYDIEALQTLLPKKRTQRWYQLASTLQTSLGAQRDVIQAAALIAALGLDAGLVEFLRGPGLGPS